MNYYLVGIKGTGMAALAMYLQDLGHTVEGSDESTTYFTEGELIKRNIPIYSFDVANIDGKSIYIISYGQIDNPETKKIIKHEYHHYYYSQFIGLIPYKNFIGVSGTHGKTTTAKLLAHLLKSKDVSYIIGSGEGYGSFKSKELIVEACEYQEHFLMYKPKVLIVNNIEYDHPDYYKSLRSVVNAFQKLANKSELIIANGDDKNILKIKHHNITYFGFNQNNDISCAIKEEASNYYLIEVNTSRKTYTYQLPFTGIHMIYNFLACFTYLYLKEDASLLSQLNQNLKTFSYPQRRKELTKINNCILVDDYAHHPTEIRALYDSLQQAYPQHKLKVIFQPHTYSRTIKYRKEFIKALDLFDIVYLQKTFTSKREKYNPRLERKIQKIFKKHQVFTDRIVNNIAEDIEKNNKNIWVFLGAGTLNNYYEKLLIKYNKQKCK